MTSKLPACAGARPARFARPPIGFSRRATCSCCWACQKTSSPPRTRCCACATEKARGKTSDGNAPAWRVRLCSHKRDGPCNGVRPYFEMLQMTAGHCGGRSGPDTIDSLSHRIRDPLHVESPPRHDAAPVAAVATAIEMADVTFGYDPR